MLLPCNQSNPPTEVNISSDCVFDFIWWQKVKTKAVTLPPTSVTELAEGLKGESLNQSISVKGAI